jgi:hypothetical protein
MVSRGRTIGVPARARRATEAPNVSAADLSPAILKLSHLRLIAAETLGAALGVSRHLDELRADRGRIVREKHEVEQHYARTGQTRRNQLAYRLAYADAAIAAAGLRFEELNAEASNARASADNLAEHLRRELAAMGLQ